MFIINGRFLTFSFFFKHFRQDKGDILLNVYSALVVNPDKVSVKNVEMAQNLVDFLVSPDIQKLIGDYGVKEYGMQLFTPCAGAEPQ